MHVSVADTLINSTNICTSIKYFRCEKIIINKLASTKRPIYYCSNVKCQIYKNLFKAKPLDKLWHRFRFE